MNDDRQEDRESVDDKTSRVDRMKRREALRCQICPPNRGENFDYKRHGKQKRRDKNKRRA